MRELHCHLGFTLRVKAIYCVNDREKAACKEECEAQRKSAEGRECLSKAHRRALTILCIQKGKRTHMRIRNTRLLKLIDMDLLRCVSNSLKITIPFY